MTLFSMVIVLSVARAIRLIRRLGRLIEPPANLTVPSALVIWYSPSASAADAVVIGSHGRNIAQTAPERILRPAGCRVNRALGREHDARFRTSMGCVFIGFRWFVNRMTRQGIKPTESCFARGIPSCTEETGLII